MGQWLALIPRLLTLLTTILETARSNRERKTGRAEAVGEALDNAIKDIARAQQARIAQRNADRALGDPRLHDDGFLRKGD